MIDINLGDQPLVLWSYLAVLALTPIMVTIVGFYISSAIKRSEHQLTSAQRQREIRKDLYDQFGPQLNRIYCYVTDLGDYSSYTPPDVIQFKRDADRSFYTYQSLWSAATRTAYAEFMSAAFRTHTGVGVPAKIRSMKNQKYHACLNAQRPWNTDFDDMFTEEDGRATATAAYDKLVASFLADITT